MTIRAMALGALSLDACSEPAGSATSAVRRVMACELRKPTTGKSRRISDLVQAAGRVVLGVGVQVVEDIAETREVVAMDQPLGRLDDDLLRLRLEHARARVAGARARLVEAQSTDSGISGRVRVAVGPRGRRQRRDSGR